MITEAKTIGYFSSRAKQTAPSGCDDDNDDDDNDDSDGDRDEDSNMNDSNKETRTVAVQTNTTMARNTTLGVLFGTGSRRTTATPRENAHDSDPGDNPPRKPRFPGVLWCFGCSRGTGRAAP